MNKYIVKVIENRIYEFVIKADSKEEAEKKYYEEDYDTVDETGEQSDILEINLVNDVGQEERL